MKCGVQIIEDNFNDMFSKAFYEINRLGSWQTARGLDFKEIVAPQLILTNPKNCLITASERKLNYAYLIIEKMMYLSGKSVPEILIAYNPKMKDFLNEKLNDFDGAYGPRIRNFMGEIDQLEWCYDQLKKDPDTRQAVITIHDARDCRKTKDNACTLSLQFLLRDNELTLITNMRSNDLLWGTCLDVPAFCFFQEVMAYWLGVEVGAYIHQPASLHFYKEFEEKLFGIDEKRYLLNDEEIPTWDIDCAYTDDALKEFWRAEKEIRETSTFVPTEYKVINAYLHRLLKFWDNKKTKQHENA